MPLPGMSPLIGYQTQTVLKSDTYKQPQQKHVRFNGSKCRGLEVELKHHGLSEGVRDPRSPHSCECEREFSLSSYLTGACGVIWQ